MFRGIHLTINIKLHRQNLVSAKFVTMKSYKRSIFVVFALVLLLYWGELLLWHLLQRFINVVFPKEPNIFKVRNMEGTKAFNGEIVLDFVSTLNK